MKKVILAAAACSVLSLLPVCGYSQQQLGAPAAPDKVSGGSGGSSGLGSLYSPSLYDGTVNISVPIFPYSAEGGEYGVSLGYNTKGVTIDELSSDAGLHWQVNAGFAINRVMKDLPDEINLTDGDTAIYLGNPYPPSAWPAGYTPGYDTTSINHYWCFKGKYASYWESAGSLADTGVYRDGEADEFVVNLASGSFTFYMGRNNVFFTHPNRRVKIESLLGGLPLTSIGDLQVVGSANVPGIIAQLSFRITDEQGNVYEFEAAETDRRDIYDNYNKGQYLTAYKYVTRWVASRVQMADGRQVIYNYGAVVPTGGTSSTILTRNWSFQAGFMLWNWPDPAGSDVPRPAGNKLLSIFYPNNVQVYFDYSSQGREDISGTALRQFRVTSADKCLRYILQQSYFYATNLQPGAPYGTAAGGAFLPDNLRKRLKLNGLILGSCDSTILEPLYSFGYESLELPPRLDCRKDFFGYFNDKSFYGRGSTADEQVPRTIPYNYIWRGAANGHNNYETLYKFGQDRSVDPLKAKASLLNRITNATGGSALFRYEGHQLNNVLTHTPTDTLYQGSEADDGVRIASILETEPYRRDTLVTEFSYSNGQRFLSGGYFHYQQMIDSTGLDDGRPEFLSSIIMTSNYLTPHQLVGGSNHGYGHVEVLKRQGIRQLSRKTVNFSNFKDGAAPAKYYRQGGGKDFFTYPYANKQYLLDWQMGLPLSMNEYDEHDRILSWTTNNYRNTFDSTSSAGVVENRARALVTVGGARLSGYSWTFLYRNREITDDYRPYTGKALLQSTTIRKYVSDNNYIYDSTAYAYDYRDNLDYIITRNSKGAFIKTDQVYNYDMPGPGTAFDMSAARLEKMTGTERWLLGSGGNPDRLLDATINSYTFSGGILQPQNLYQLRTSTPLTYSILTGYSGGGTPAYPHGYMNAAYNGSAIDYFSKISEVTQRDANGNPLETYMPATGQYKAMIWDGNNNRKLAEAGSCRYEDIAYSSFEEVVPPFPPTAFRGNLEYSNLGVQLYTVLGERAPTGSMVYRLHSGILPTSLATAMPLQPDKTYILSFWYTSTGSLTAMPHVDIAGTNQPFTSNDEIATRGSWKQYQLRITPATTGPVTITAGSSTDILIDEVRLFPLGALMESQCGEPLFGPTSTTDGSGRITYYEYDQLGRQSVVRDQEGNILSRTKNVVRGSD